MTKKFFKMNLILMLIVLTCLLFSACSYYPQKPTERNPEKPSSLTTEMLRIVDGAETGNLVLAGGNAGDIYTLNAATIPVYLDDKPADISALEDGMMAEISYDGNIMESYPAQFGDVSSISVYSLGTEKNPGGTMYDLCGLYLQVLNDLWGEDSGLNSDITYISVDLSNAPYDLTEGEKSAIAWIFASEHQVEGLTLSYEELVSEGYLTEIDDSDYYDWEDGILFSITPTEELAEIQYFLPTARFNAEKWRSPLGAYRFSECEAIWPEVGTWSTYTVGEYMIS